MTEHAVHLESLPSGFEFPAETASRIHFDPVRRRLVLRGFMFKADYDRLMRCDGGVAWRRAVQTLFQCSSDATTPPIGRLGGALAVLAASCLLLAGVTWWRLSRPASGPDDAPLTSGSAAFDRLAEIGPSLASDRPSHGRRQ